MTCFLFAIAISFFSFNKTVSISFWKILISKGFEITIAIIIASRVLGYGKDYKFTYNGTYYEVDGGGNRVVHVVGDNYELVAGSNYVNVKGEANLTVEGTCNTLVKEDWNIKVEGDLNLEVVKDFNTIVQGDTTQLYESKLITTALGAVSSVYNTTFDNIVVGAVTDTYGATIDRSITGAVTGLSTNPIVTVGTIKSNSISSFESIAYTSPELEKVNLSLTSTLVNGKVVVKNGTKNKDIDAIPYPATKVFSGGTRIDDY